MTEETSRPRTATHAASAEWPWWHGAVGRTKRRATLTAAFMLASLASGCDRREPGDPASAETGVTIRDSAGVEIVENHFPEHPPERFWRMEMEPEIVLGGGDRPPLAGDSAHLIWRVSGLARLEDGRVAVLSRGHRQLYLFEPTGELSRVMGRGGRGPGEFSGPAELQYLPPDTLAVWDSWFGPVNYFDTGGELIRTRSVDLGKVMGEVNGLSAESRRIPLADGSFVTEIVKDDPTRQFLVGTVVRSSIEFVRIDQEYGIRSLGIWEGLEIVGVDYGAALIGPSFTGLDAFLAAGSDPPSIHIADGTRDEIRQFSFDGRLVRIIRRSTAPLRVSDEGHQAWATYLATPWATVQGGEDRVEAVLRVIPRRDFHPPVAGLLVDPEGYLWVSGWSASEVGGPDRWSVFSPEGRWVGVLPAPMLEVQCNRFSNPCWMGTDFFLAVRRDKVGRELVEGYRIRRRD